MQTARWNEKVLLNFECFAVNLCEGKSNKQLVGIKRILSVDNVDILIKVE